MFPRLPSLKPNALAQIVTSRRRRGDALFDLTVSNPTAVGLDLDDAALQQAYADAVAAEAMARYAPTPAGRLEARRAVAAAHGEVDPDHVVLCSCTSEAYSYIFKLLAQWGEEVLIPQPSYPLLDHLARLEGLEPRAYPLSYDDGWRVDLAAVADVLTPQTRAVVLVSPNNPTGSYVAAEQLAELDELLGRRRIALIVDEVFHDYPADGAARPLALATARHALTFSLGGLSKSCALPQAKLSWMALAGPEARVLGALDGLDVIADSYLTLSSLVQQAAPALLALAPPRRAAVRARVAENRALLDELIAAKPAVSQLRSEGGWSAMLRLPGVVGEERLSIELAEHDGVIAYPGYFFDLYRGTHVVLSALCEPSVLTHGVERLLARLP